MEETENEASRHARPDRAGARPYLACMPHKSLESPQ